MARTALTATKSTKGSREAFITKIEATEAASDNVNGHSFTHTGKEVLVVRNSAGGAGTITFYRKNFSDSVATALTAISVAAGKTVLFGPLSADQFTQTDGNVYFDTSAATMNVTLFQLDSPHVITR